MLDNRGPMSDRTCAIIAVVLLGFLIGSVAVCTFRARTALDTFEQHRLLR